MPSIATYQLVLSAVSASEDKKAEDIRILALDPTESGLSDYFLICNGTNTRQNIAIADEIELRLKRDFGLYPNSVEGRREGEWVLMDYVDFIVHVFSPEKREYYGLERLRKSASTVSPDELNAELKLQIRATRSREVSQRAILKRDLAAGKTAEQTKAVTARAMSRKEATGAKPASRKSLPLKSAQSERSARSNNTAMASASAKRKSNDQSS